MENQMTSLKCRKCGALVTADQKKCPKCNAPILLKVMMEEEKRHLPAKEIREKDKRMRQEYAKMNKEKELERQKADKKEKLLREKAEKKREREKAELAVIREKEEKRARTAREKEEKLQTKKEALEAKKAEKALKKEEKNGKSPLFAIIITAIIILAVAGAVTLYMLNRPENTETDPVQEPEITETAEEEEPINEEVAEVTEEVAEVVEEPAPAEEPQQPQEQEKPKETAPKRNITRNNYLFPSDSQYLTESDVTGLSKFDTGLIRNEIYARKGYVFKDDPYKSYFNSQAWYNPNPSAKMNLNEIEKYNVNFLLEYERSQGWR